MNDTLNIVLGYAGVLACPAIIWAGFKYLAPWKGNTMDITNIILNPVEKIAATDIGEFLAAHRADFYYRLVIRLPGDITDEQVDEAMASSTTLAEYDRLIAELTQKEVEEFGDQHEVTLDGMFPERD